VFQIKLSEHQFRQPLDRAPVCPEFTPTPLSAFKLWEKKSTPTLNRAYIYKMADVNAPAEAPETSDATPAEVPATPSKPAQPAVPDIPVEDVVNAFKVLGGGKYELILLNTPWHRLSASEIAELPIESIAADNATLMMWCDSITAGVTSKILRKWGFSFHSVASILNIATPPAVAEPPAPAPAPAATDMDVDASDASKAPLPTAPRSARVKAIHPPAWWYPTPAGATNRACTEQLWVATKGEGASLTPKVKSYPYQVTDMPDYPKKASKARKTSATCPPEWYCTRPSEFFENAMSMYPSSVKAIELFGDAMRQNVDAFGPGIPTMFMPALSGKSGDVGVIKAALEGMGKVILRGLSAKLHKALQDSTAIEEKVVQDFIASIGDAKWTAQDRNTLMILSSVADSALASYPQRRKKTKRVRDGSSSVDKPRHGIARPGTVSNVLLDFFGEPEGTLLARTDVVKRINEYIKANDLKYGKFFKLDDKLKQLLGDIEKSNYFELHSLLSPHFLKVEKVESDSEPSTKKTRVE
jgi:SWIB/MDM2 domain